MKLLHTGDWHLGKVLRGRSRHDEQVAVMAEIVELTERERVDLVVVAGDVFESAAPPTEAQQLAWSTLLALRATGAEVVVVAGNHDHGPGFEALAPVFAAAGITVRGTIRRPDDGGVLDLSVGGHRARVSIVPWLSPRHVVRAAMLLERDAAELGQVYSERLQRVIGALAAPAPVADPGSVDVVVAHAFVRGGLLGGGERDAQTINDYGISATAFPAGVGYVALGHLHRHQRVPGPCPIVYAGAPLAVDFGEEADRKGVVLVELDPGSPARVEHRPIEAARRLRTIRGSLAELTERAESLRGGLLRVELTEPNRAGLADAVRAVLPDALEVRLPAAPEHAAASVRPDRRGRSPQESFAAYLVESGVDDPRLVSLFGELLADELDDPVEVS